MGSCATPWSRRSAALRAQGLDEAALDARFERLHLTPVLTAHPTEARRRTTLLALRRCARLLERTEDHALGPAEHAEAMRSLREELALLWHTAPVRPHALEPLDEVRTAMAFFDETLFGVVPQLYRAADMALDPDSGARPPRVPAFLRLGSWIGADRDGNPSVTAEHTTRTMRIQADHVLRGYEAVATRLMQVLAVTGMPAGDAALAARLTADTAAFPNLARQLVRRFPDEPYRRRFGFIAERLRRTRARLVDGDRDHDGYASPAALDGELVEIQAALVADGLVRVAYGEVQDLRWRLATFGFHLASLEVRQHAAVHHAALEAIRAGAAGTVEVAPGVTLDDVLATFGAMAAIQADLGPEACRRYIVSFTSTPQDVLEVLDLAAACGVATRRTDGAPRAGPGAPPGVAGGARGGGRPPRRAPGRSSLPRPPGRPRRSPGGDAGLLGLQQGGRLPRRELAALPGAGGAGGHGSPSRRGADALPRTGRRHRARRWAGQPGHPRPGAGFRGRAPQADRAG